MLTGVFATLKLASRKVKHGKCRQQAAKTYNHSLVHSIDSPGA